MLTGFTDQLEKRSNGFRPSCPGQDVGQLDTLMAGVWTSSTSIESNLAIANKIALNPVTSLLNYPNQAFPFLAICSIDILTHVK